MVRQLAQEAGMQILYERCAAVEVGKDVIAIAARLQGGGPDGRQTVKRTFKTFYGVLREAARWLVALEVTHVAMEATGIYSMPVYHALIEHGNFEKVLVCNAAHVKNVPGRKTDLADAEWLAHLLECGLLAGSFIPPAQVKAARDVIRYRAKVVQSRTSEIQRLGSVLQDAGIKTGLRRLLDHHQVRPGDDRGPHRRRAPRDGAGGSGQRQDARQDPGPGDGAGGPLR
jgi:transposase